VKASRLLTDSIPMYVHIRQPIRWLAPAHKRRKKNKIIMIFMQGTLKTQGGGEGGIGGFNGGGGESEARI
jgi:hypothetical protein